MRPPRLPTAGLPEASEPTAKAGCSGVRVEPGRDLVGVSDLLQFLLAHDVVEVRESVGSSLLDNFQASGSGVINAFLSVSPTIRPGPPA
jgi:hypothetical protein